MIRRRKRRIETPEAQQLRSRRQHFAAPGGSHDKLVHFLARALPMGVGVLAALMVITPLSPRGEISFLLDRNEVAVIQERLRVDNALYRGTDAQGRPFSLTADEAVQRSSAEGIVRMRDIVARLLMAEGPARISAEGGQYDIDAERIDVTGTMRMEAADGYRMRASGVSVQLDNKTVTGAGGVEGAVPAGTFSANRLDADLGGKDRNPNGRSALAHGTRKAENAMMKQHLPAMTKSLLAGFALTCAALGGMQLNAQAIASHNSNAPVSFDAGRIELQDRQNRVVLSGAVRITQAGLTLNAARTVVDYSDAGTLEIQRILATGGVTVSRGNERASGDTAVYDFNRRIITMAGNVSLNRGTDRLNGGRLVIDLASGVSSVDGRASGSSSVTGETQQSGGRVTGTFSVPQD